MLTSSTSLPSLIQTIGVDGVDKLCAAHILTHETIGMYKDMKAAANRAEITLWESNDGNNTRECVFLLNGATFYAEAIERGTVVCTQASPMTWQEYCTTVSKEEQIKVRKTIRMFMDNKELFCPN